jgi:hypothetical protein
MKLCFLVALIATGLLVAAQGQTNTAAASISTNVVLWPTLGYTNFMVDAPDQIERRQLWNYFLIVEREAKRLAGTVDHWEPLRVVKFGPGGPMWFSGGTLRLSDVSDHGAMFHEIFHNVFNRSQFHQGDDNGWGEGFCDAFRYMMEKKYVPGPRTSWFEHLDSLTYLTYEQVMAKSGDKHFDQTYFYPASLIIRKSGKDFDRFTALWFELQALHERRHSNVLNSYFGYDIQKGKPL